MTSVLHTVLPFIAVNADVKRKHAEVMAQFNASIPTINPHFVDYTRTLINSAAKSRDVDALSIMLRIPPADHRLVGLAITALREALDNHRVSHIITPDHVVAYGSVLTCYLHASNITGRGPLDPVAANVHDLMVAVYQNYDRLPECLTAITERCAIDAQSLTDTLRAMGSVHPALSEGAL